MIGAGQQAADRCCSAADTGDVVGRRRDSSRLAPIINRAVTLGLEADKDETHALNLESRNAIDIRHESAPGKSFEEGPRIVHDGQERCRLPWRASARMQRGDAG